MLFDLFKKKTSCCGESQPKVKTETFQTIELNEALKLYETQKNDYVWLDVRTHKEYNEGHLPGAKHIPIDEIEHRLSQVGSPDQKYIVYCHSGSRSAKVCHFLAQKGFKHLTNYVDGMSGWTGPVE